MVAERGKQHAALRGGSHLLSEGGGCPKQTRTSETLQGHAEEAGQAGAGHLQLGQGDWLTNPAEG